VGLLRIHEGCVRFRHPLVRSGVLQSETLTRRQAAHAALAEVLADQAYRRTWHRAQSVAGPDDGILVRAGASCAMGIPSLPALSQGRGLTT